MSDFEGKVALITGAADGIGFALASALGRAGARVFMSDIAADKLEERAAEIGAANAPCDVSDADAVAELVDRAWTEVGPIDLLCANAGVMVSGSILEARQEDIDFIFGVNIWGIVNACRPFVRKLRETGRGGAMLLTGSEHSLSNPQYLRTVPMHLYNLTKHAVLSIGDSLRAELASDGVQVSVLCPGPVVSGLATNSSEFRPARFGQAVEAGPPDLLGVDTDRLAELYIPADRAAEIALKGIREGVFAIPTHAFEKDDVDARHRELLAGFDLLA
ncbi:MAG: hypothetical protein CL908_05120 [Deltaproteobacteria bacterium]|nr:hypothetical protein [Deltaproteobacteria bacterium]